MSSTIPESIRELAAGYALGALTPAETAAFEAALARSPELAREVAEYREVNALLARGVAGEPSPLVKARMFQRIGQEKEVALRPGRRWLAPVLGLTAAAAAVWGLSLDRRVRALTDQLGRRDVKLVAVEAQLSQRELTINTLLTAEADLKVVQLTTSGTGAPGIQFFWNRRSNMGVLHAFRLPQTAKGKVYQLWLIRGGKPYPSATFTAEYDGHALVQAFALPEGAGFEAVAVTIEPEGGSTTPTMPIVLLGKV